MNILDDIPESFKDEITNILFEQKNVRIERIVSDGQVSPPGFWYDQSETEVVFIIEGRGVIQYSDGSKVILKQGDCEIIHSHTKHRVCYTSRKEKTVWLAVFIA